MIKLCEVYDNIMTFLEGGVSVDDAEHKSKDKDKDKEVAARDELTQADLASGLQKLHTFDLSPHTTHANVNANVVEDSAHDEKKGTRAKSRPMCPTCRQICKEEPVLYKLEVFNQISCDSTQPCFCFFFFTDATGGLLIQVGTALASIGHLLRNLDLSSFVN
ncbi:hypothetical protein RFI_23949 [Reticulomyxa filosa]|uniref:Uncharacterized protein n=1 Tax=Reticulomyxa filosa TaxID=46433 RepID=X6MHG2_RETFI|nr:hypothetical protein RFI_23949 [Reticulomyxa filosa]|eukprot:ETO13428.1 hypothetical protein RFI_23949 [Reticulomyxa filosa]